MAHRHVEVLAARRRKAPSTAEHTGDSAMVDVGIEGITDAVEIGRGGFGVVYRATEADLSRDVAVKLLPSDLDQRARDRFDRERKAMGSLSGHPNIVTVYRSGFTDSGRPYIVMEYLAAGAYDDVIARRGPLEWRDACRLGAEVAGALSQAHAAGVLHRDIKPGNILEGPDGRARLADFGIARITGSPETTSSTVTASVAHAAPEVINGRRPTESADLYSLASTLYELVTGMAPFANDAEETMVPMLARIARDPVPEHPAVPPALHETLSRAMAKDPDDRHESATGFGQDLLGLLTDAGSLSPAERSRTVHFAAPPPVPDGTPAPPEPTAVESATSDTPPPGVGHVPAPDVGTVAPPPTPGAATPDDPTPADPGPASPPPSNVGEPSSPAARGRGASAVDRRVVVIGLVAVLVVVTLVVVLWPRSSGPDLPRTGPPEPAGYTTIFDVTGALSVDVPVAWTDVELGSGIPQTGLAAGVDLASARATFDTPAVTIDVTRSPLVDADAVLDSFDLNACDEAGTGDYSDPAYSGRFRRFDGCGGSDATVWMVAAAPDQNDFWVFVVVQTVSRIDESAARRILDTFFVERLAL